MYLQHDKLTIRQAANFLNVSQDYFIRLLSEGAIVAHTMSDRCYILFQDLVDYKHLSQLQSGRCLNELTAQAQKLDMGY